MPPKTPDGPRYIAFQRGKRVAQGAEAEVIAQLAAQSISPYAYGPEAEHTAQALVFELSTGAQVELPPTPAPVPAGLEPTGRPGRPKLGVVAREVTLLPHDWEWLNQQPGGASVTLRRLVLKARRFSEGADRIRQAQVVCYRFISAIAGNEPGYEEATRALFTGKPDAFDACTATWPADVRDHARQLAAMSFEPTTAPPANGDTTEGAQP